MHNVNVCLLLQGSKDKVTLVELPDFPKELQQKMISPTEVVRGPQPAGQVITIYKPARNLIKITKALGTQRHFGANYITFEYKAGSYS